jgi:hypothetical protein
MYAMYYASMLRCWQLIRILIMINYPCLRVGHHRDVRRGRLIFILHSAKGIILLRLVWSVKNGKFCLENLWLLEWL